MDDQIGSVRVRWESVWLLHFAAARRRPAIVAPRWPPHKNFSYLLSLLEECPSNRFSGIRIEPSAFYVYFDC
jgi:hypothetical protein